MDSIYLVSLILRLFITHRFNSDWNNVKIWINMVIKMMIFKANFLILLNWLISVNNIKFSYLVGNIKN